ncbi:MAG: hypothetical protein HY986_13805 [Candidatus Melainabacteria bacterium]|nr:hypothetical protein [Candidatus Melainabacteria bacterium]
MKTASTERSKTLLALTTAGLCLVMAPLKGVAQETGKGDKPAEDGTAKASKLSKSPRVGARYSPSEFLSDLRDTRLSLGQVKQQAVNLFLEATRPELTTEAKLIEHSPQTITAAMYIAGKKYQEPRKEWLVFYINTLEPILQLLNEDLKDAEENGLRLPDGLDKKITPLWKPWKQEVIGINKAMDDLQEQIGQENNNAALAKTALTIFNQVSKLERIRYQAAQVCLTEIARSKSVGKVP